MKYDHDAIRAEIERLKSDGVIRPVDVVEAAREESSPLHDWFQWDDSEAAHQYRLIQARNMLRVYVKVADSDNEPVQAFVSLTTDRVKAGGGYRAMVDVLSDETMSAQLLQDALTQLNNMRQKYGRLQQLVKVWEEVDRVQVVIKRADAA